MLWIRLIPIYIVIILQMAHYLRAENYGAMAFWTIVPFMLFLQRKWATRLVQLFLIIGSIIWIETIYWNESGYRFVEGLNGASRS